MNVKASSLLLSSVALLTGLVSAKNKYQTEFWLSNGMWNSMTQMDEDEFSTAIKNALSETFDGEDDIKIKDIDGFTREVDEDYYDSAEAAPDVEVYLYMVESVFGKVLCKTWEICDDYAQRLGMEANFTATESADEDDDDEDDDDSDDDRRRRLKSIEQADCCSDEFTSQLSYYLSAEDQDDPFFETVETSTEPKGGEGDNEENENWFDPEEWNLVQTIVWIIIVVSLCVCGLCLCKCCGCCCFKKSERDSSGNAFHSV